MIFLRKYYVKISRFNSLIWSVGYQKLRKGWMFEINQACSLWLGGKSPKATSQVSNEDEKNHFVDRRGRISLACMPSLR